MTSSTWRFKLIKVEYFPRITVSIFVNKNRNWLSSERGRWVFGKDKVHKTLLKRWFHEFWRGPHWMVVGGFQNWTSLMSVWKCRFDCTTSNNHRHICRFKGQNLIFYRFLDSGLSERIDDYRCSARLHGEKDVGTLSRRRPHLSRKIARRTSARHRSASQQHHVHRASHHHLRHSIQGTLAARLEGGPFCVTLGTMTVETRLIIGPCKAILFWCTWKVTNGWENEAISNATSDATSDATCQQVFGYLYAQRNRYDTGSHTRVAAQA